MEKKRQEQRAKKRAIGKQRDENRGAWENKETKRGKKREE